MSRRGRHGAFVALALASAACAKDERPSKAAPAGNPRGTSIDPEATLAAAFHRDYTALDGRAAFERYHGKTIALRGTVERVLENSTGEAGLWLEVDGASYISLKFADGGERLKRAEIESGAEVSASCEVGGMLGNNVMMVSCSLSSHPAGRSGIEPGQ